MSIVTILQGDSSPQPVSSKNPMPVTGSLSLSSTSTVTPLGDAQGSVTNASQLISAIAGAIPATTVGARIDVEGGNVRWTGTTGNAPTSTSGARLLQDSAMEYTGDLTQLRFILESGAASAKLNVFWYK